MMIESIRGLEQPEDQTDIDLPCLPSIPCLFTEQVVT